MCLLSWTLCTKQGCWIAEQCTGAEVACSFHCACIALGVAVLNPLLGGWGGRVATGVCPMGFPEFLNAMGYARSLRVEAEDGIQLLVVFHIFAGQPSPFMHGNPTLSAQHIPKEIFEQGVR